MATKKTGRDLASAETAVSRSEKKRLAKRIELLAVELTGLPPVEIEKLPASPELKAEIVSARKLAGGALKRQVKFIAGLLRDTDPDPFLGFLAERRASHLKQDEEFHQLERMREEIITEVLRDREDAQRKGERLNESWQSKTISSILSYFPGINGEALKKSALRYAATRKPVHRREIFRQLQAAANQARFAKAAEEIPGNEAFQDE